MADETLLILAAVALATTGVALVLFAGGRLHELAGYVLFAMAGCCMAGRVVIAFNAYEDAGWRRGAPVATTPALRASVAARSARATP